MEDEVKVVKKHRVKDGKMEFLTVWKGKPESESTWEPASRFVQSFSNSWLQYLTRHGLDADLPSLLNSPV